jgi:hypothetical protein
MSFIGNVGFGDEDGLEEFSRAWMYLVLGPL